MVRLRVTELSCGAMVKYIKDSFKMVKCMVKANSVIIPNLISNKMHFMRVSFC